MAKRKRTVEETVEEQLQKFGQDVFHALKLAKGFERQRQAKRLKDSKATPEKKQRLQKEIVVLKSLDLHQAAYAHLCASLLKIKSVAAAPNLPSELKSGPPKPDISEEEKIALHNVTSALYNRKEVKQALDKAIPAFCGTLGVEVPLKKGKGPANGARKGKEEQPADEDVSPEPPKPVKLEKAVKKEVKKTPVAVDELPDDDVEEAITKYEELLGGSSEEDSGSEGDDEEDPMQVTSDEGEEDDGFDEIGLDGEDGEEESDDDDSFGGFSSDEEVGAKPKAAKAGAKVAKSVESSDSEHSEEEKEEDEDSDDSGAISRSPSPKRSKRKRVAEDTGPTVGSTFLPSLMGGYISGSESASDVDIAPPRKNRRGQRARQAIWEKKFKEEAKHLSKPQRDQGWDPKRGAVDGSARTPWKRGIANPFSRSEGNGQEPVFPKKPRTTDNAGPLHPSWEAKKKAEEKQKNVKFEGTKIKFD